jgi:hypothetical protein
MRLVVGGLVVRPVYPQFRKCRVRRGSYASCHIRTFTANEVARAKSVFGYASSASSSAFAGCRSGVSKYSVDHP